MTELTQHGWEEPETIQRWVVLPFPVERAVGQYAEDHNTTSLEVIAELLEESLVERGYPPNGNSSQPEHAPDSSAPVSSEHD